MVEGVVVEQPAAVRATTAGEVFGISEQTVSVPPGDVGLTFDWPLVVKEVAAGSPYSAGCRRALRSWRWAACAPRPITFETKRGASS